MRQTSFLFCGVVAGLLIVALNSDDVAKDKKGVKKFLGKGLKSLGVEVPDQSGSKEGQGEQSGETGRKEEKQGNSGKIEQIAITERYLKMPDRLRHGWHFQIREKNGIWTAPGEYDEDILPDVDIENNYIFIKSQGTGAGYAGNEMTVFVDEDGNEIIAFIEHTFNDPETGNSSVVKLYSTKDGFWNNVTSKLIDPPNDRNVFLEGVEIPQGLENVDSIINGGSIVYGLPKADSVIVSHLDLYNAARGTSPNEQRDLAYKLFHAVAEKRWSFPSNRN